MNRGGPLGLYVHVPFCAGKCPYCDFYSLRGTQEKYEEYTSAVTKALKSWSKRLERPAKTLYFGGGTPSLLGAEHLSRIILAARECFLLPWDAEITVEVNPGGKLDSFFKILYGAGANRVSLGLQSADDGELYTLGRAHTAEQAFLAVEQAKRAGFENISLDLMLAVSGQTKESLRRSVKACALAGVQHVSAYLLKVEPGTAYFKNQDSLVLPDEDETCELYLEACAQLERLGFAQYEISNFAKSGFEGKHNLIYWEDGEYLGVGPSAHSFVDGKRFYYEKSLRGFLAGEEPVQDDGGSIASGGLEEYAMLALRLRAGITDAACQKRFGRPIPPAWKAAARRYAHAGLTECGGDFIRFTPKGFLVSNALLAEILSADETA